MKTMSHHFPYEAEDGAPDDTSNRWTRTTPLSQSFDEFPIALPQHRQNGNRSHPIAILRGSDHHYTDSSDGEFDDDVYSMIDLELDALSIATEKDESSMLSSSLPSHLLRAPRLTALPDNQNICKPLMQYPSMLPPAMASADNPLGAIKLSGVVLGTEDQTSYGSLRDSNSRGRFLDGPSSYRDKNTGDIRVLEHRVRFRDEQNMAQSLPASLSIGERMMQSSLKRKESFQRLDKPQPTSSLSALMEASTDDLKPSPIQQRQDTNRTITFYDEECTTKMPNNMLSTSLTGLEVLQAGFCGNLHINASPNTDAFGSARPNHTRKVEFEKLDEIPRDEFGKNSLLSRSLSDPTPDHSWSPAVRVHTSPSHSNCLGSEGTISPLHLVTFQNFRTESTCSPPLSHRLDPLPLHFSSPRESNLDVECGFDFDME